jgi:hypothetical protein
LQTMLSSLIHGSHSQGFHYPPDSTGLVTEPEVSSAERISHTSSEQPEGSSMEGHSSTQDVDILSGAKKIWQRLTSLGPPVDQE